MTKRLALAFGTRDRVELSRQSLLPLIHPDVDLWVVDGSKTEVGREFAEDIALCREGAHVHTNIHGGADAWIAYALSTLLKETESPYVGLCENDVLLHRDWLAPTLQLFSRGRAEGLEVGAVSARCYEDRILCQRDGYALVHNLGAGHIILTRRAARLILDNFRTSWATENRRVFNQLCGIDIGKYWAFRGSQQMITADWGFDRVLAANGLASLALTPSPVEMIGQVPPLAEQGLKLATEPVELLHNDKAFYLFAGRTQMIREGMISLASQRFLRYDDGSQMIFPHQITSIGAENLGGEWTLKWSQGFGPFSYVGAEHSQLLIPVSGPCSFYVSGGKDGGKFEIEDTHSGYKASPDLAPEGTDGQVMALAVPGNVTYRDIRLTALTPGVVFYGVQVHEPQPVDPTWSFDHAQLPPVG
jgi:hypothetical protein